jgi:hypothetical protein
MEVIGFKEFRYNIVNANTTTMVVTDTDYILTNNTVTMNLYQNAAHAFKNEKGTTVAIAGASGSNIALLEFIIGELGLGAPAVDSPFALEAFNDATEEASKFDALGLTATIRTINPSTVDALTTAVTELKTSLALVTASQLAASVSKSLVIDVGTDAKPNRITVNVNLIKLETVKPFVTEIRILDGLNYRSIPVGTKTTETYKWNEAYFTKIQLVFSEPVLVTAKLQVTAGGNFVEAATSTLPRTVIDMVLSANTANKNEFVPGEIPFAIAQDLVTDLHGNTNAAKSIDVTFSKAP